MFTRENSRDFTTHHYFLSEMTSEKRAQKFHTVTNLELDVASDWLKQISHTEQPNRSNIQIWKVPARFVKLQIMLYIFYQRHPTTVFCKISVWRSKYYLEFSITWGRLKFSRWQFLWRTIFAGYLRGGEWYLEKRGSRKILVGSRNLGSVFDKSRSLVFSWFVFTFLSVENFHQRVSGSDF